MEKPIGLVDMSDNFGKPVIISVGDIVEGKRNTTVLRGNKSQGILKGYRLEGLGESVKS